MRRQQDESTRSCRTPVRRGLDTHASQRSARRDEETSRSVAACVCFSFGDVPRRIGEAESMAQLHAKVGRYAEDLHKPTERFMSSLPATHPAWRVNWNLVFTGSLSPHPDRYVHNLEKRQRSACEHPRWSTGLVTALPPLTCALRDLCQRTIPEIALLARRTVS